MSTKKKQHVKQAVKQQIVEKSQEEQWAEQIHPGLIDFFNQKVKDDVERDYPKGERPLHYGSQVDVDLEHRRFEVLESFSWEEEGFLDKAGQPLEAIHHLGYLRFDALKSCAKKAHDAGVQVELMWAYVPYVEVTKSTEPNPTAWLDDIELTVRQRLNRLQPSYDAVKERLLDELGERNEESIYVGTRMYLDPDTGNIQYVVERRHALDFIRQSELTKTQQDFRDFEEESIEARYPTTIHPKDPTGRNYRACVARLLGEGRHWDRITRPSEACFGLCADEVVTFIIKKAEVVLDKALETAKGLGVSEDVTLVLDPVRGVLKAVYVKDGETKEVPIGQDALAVYWIRGRIDPELDFFVQDRLYARFEAVYGGAPLDRALPLTDLPPKNLPSPDELKEFKRLADEVEQMRIQ